MVYIVCEKGQYSRLELTACSDLYGKLTSTFKAQEGDYKLIREQYPDESHTLNVRWLGDKKGGFVLRIGFEANAVRIIGYH